MNPHFRTVALAAASLGLLLSLFLALRSGNDEETGATTTDATTTALATTNELTVTLVEPPTGKPLPPPNAVTIRITVPSDTAPTVRRYSIKQNRQVVLVIGAEVADEVHLHGYDLTADVGPGKPAMIRFTATAPGRFELELEDRGLAIAELEVRP